jgi:hypothetical protein
MSAGPVRDRLANVIDVLATTVSPRPPAAWGHASRAAVVQGCAGPRTEDPILCEQSPVDTQ